MPDTAGGTTNASSAQAPSPRPLTRAALRPALKRAIDVAGAALLLLLVAPAFVLVFLLVRADGASVFVARPRVGRGGREFGHLAFRAPDANAGGRDGGGGADGEHLTRLGRFLRWTALDELPRLLNVLRGDMSLVGPCPATREELHRFSALFGGGAAYLSVRPGLTGPCQLRGGIGPRERIALEAAYAESLSLRADAVLLFRTAAAALRSQGAC